MISKKTNGNGNGKSREQNVIGFARAELIKVPVIGEICAGRGLVYFPTSKQTWITRPEGYRTGDKLVSLIVRGDSLRDAHILDGYTLVCRQNFDMSEIRDGALVAAYVVTTAELFARFIHRSEDGRIILRAANPDYKDEDFNCDEVEVHALVLEFKKSLI